MSTLAIKGSPHAAITRSEVETRGPLKPALVTEDAACKLVVQDEARAEMWLAQKQWALHWHESDILYQSPRTDSIGNTRANVSRFTVAKHVNSLVPTCMSGIFYDDPPFVLRPRPGTKQSTVRAKTALFSALLEDCDFKAECEEGTESQCLNGTGIWKYGWVTERKIVKRYIRKRSATRVNVPFGGSQEVATEESDEFEVQEIEVVTNRPFFEHKPLGTVLVDPGWRKPNKIHRAKYVIERNYVTFNDLNKLRLQDGYNIPSEQELKDLFFGAAEVPVAPGGPEQAEAQNTAVHHAESRDQVTTEDPLERPLKLVERWDKDRVMVVLQDKLTIRNEEHKLGKIPFLSANWWNVQGAGYGLGIGRLIGTDQRVEQGSMNSALDILSMAVNQTYVRSKGANVPTQQIRQRLGGIIDVDGDVEKAFKILEPPKVPNEIWTVISASKSASESTTGADEAFVQGNMPQRAGAARTATGAGNMAAASASRIQGPVGRFVDNVFIPFLRALDEMVAERMPMSEIREILSDELADYSNLDFDNFMNARLKYEVLAGAHLAAKKAMAQSLPLMIQIFENPKMLESLNSMGWTVDLKELFDMFMEMSEWKNTRDVIRKMTPEEKQFLMAMNPAMAKAMAAREESETEFQHEQQLADQKIEGRLASKVVEHALDKSSEPNPLLDAAGRATGRVARMSMEGAMDDQALDRKGEGQFFATQ